jgi:hypothetical protein
VVVAAVNKQINREINKVNRPRDVKPETNKAPVAARANRVNKAVAVKVASRVAARVVNRVVARAAKPIAKLEIARASEFRQTSSRVLNL